jgi:hypothetical protein
MIELIPGFILIICFYLNYQYYFILWSVELVSKMEDNLI